MDIPKTIDRLKCSWELFRAPTIRCEDWFLLGALEKKIFKEQYEEEFIWAKTIKHTMEQSVWWQVEDWPFRDQSIIFMRMH